MKAPQARRRSPQGQARRLGATTVARRFGEGVTTVATPFQSPGK